MLALAVFAGGQRAYAYDGGLAAGGFLDALDYKVDLDACQLLTPQARDDLANNRPLDYSIDKIKREVMGFQVGATDVRIHVKPSRIDADRILLDIDVKGKNVAVDSCVFPQKVRPP